MARKINWAEVTKQIKEQETKKFNNPEFEKETWKANAFNPVLTEAGTYECIFRFVPRPEDDGNGIPYIKEYRHAFQGPTGQWFIEACPQTHGNDCPACKANSKAWKELGDGARNLGYGKKTNFFSNVLIIKDPQNPENEGKVFIYRYGKKIHEKIMEKLIPAEGSVDEPVDVFDYKNGMNFKLKIKRVTTNIRGKEVKYPNYDSSAFTGNVAALTDEQIDYVEKNSFNLGSIVDPKIYKTFEALQERLDKVVSGITTSRSSVVVDNAEEDDVDVVADTEGDSSNEGSDVVVDDDDDFFSRLRSGKN